MKHQGFLLPEICRVLDCRVHHIRYIEEHLPIISTAYDRRGRKVYSLKDIYLFSRMLFLTRQRGLGMQEAVDVLFAELDGQALDMTARFLQIRHELLKTRLQSLEAANRLALKYRFEGLPELEAGGAAGGHEDVFHPLSFFSPEEVFPRDVYADLEEQLQTVLAEDRRPSGETAAVLGPGEPAVREDLLRDGRWVILTPDPYRAASGGRYPGDAPLTPLRRMTMLGYLAEKIRAAANSYGSYPLWVISVRKSHFYHLMGVLHHENFFDIPRRQLLVLPQPDIDEWSTGDAGGLFSFSRQLLPRLIDQDYVFGMLLSMEHPMIPLPDEQLVDQLLSDSRPMLHSVIHGRIRGELYFRISPALHIRPALSASVDINARGEAADTSSGGALLIRSNLAEGNIISRPLMWEYFPPLYARDEYDFSLLSRHMSLVWNSWAGSQGEELEISPLFARNREEFRRRRANGHPGAAGLWL